MKIDLIQHGPTKVLEAPMLEDVAECSSAQSNWVLGGGFEPINIEISLGFLAN